MPHVAGLRRLITVSTEAIKGNGSSISKEGLELGSSTRNIERGLRSGSKDQAVKGSRIKVRIDFD